MNDYAVYIWSAYIFAGIIMVWMLWQAISDFRKAQRQLEQAQAAAKSHMPSGTTRPIK